MFKNISRIASCFLALIVTAASTHAIAQECENPEALTFAIIPTRRNRRRVGTL